MTDAHPTPPGPEAKPFRTTPPGPDNTGVIVTIDGPAGTGKSSVAQQLAESLGLEFLDTGAMYRAAALLVIENSLSLDAPDDIARLVRDADIHFDWNTTPPTLYAAGAPKHDRLRDADVSALVSPVSQLPAVRNVLVEKQRRIGEVHPRLVSEGRDQGSVVFYNADAKFYLDASIETRARRRLAQLEGRGDTPDIGIVRREIEDRDRRDTSREVGPLTCPADATRVHTDDLSQAQVVERLAALVREQVPADKLREAARLG